MADPGWARVATLRSPDAFRRHLAAGGIPLAFDDALATPSDSPFARPLEADGLRAGNGGHGNAHRDDGGAELRFHVGILQ